MQRLARMLGVTIPLLLLQLANPTKLIAIDFAAAKSYPVGTSPTGIAVGDFNGDGKPDIAVANSGSSNVSILVGNGDGTFQPAVNFNAGNIPSTIAVGDFNGDGKLDLAVFQPAGSGVAGSVGILLGNGDGTFQAPKTLVLSGSASVIAVADFNLDNKSDLAVVGTDPNTGAEALNVFIGNGDGTFQAAKKTGIPASIRGFAAADFNGDLRPDAALLTAAGILILLGNGDGTFSQGATITGTDFALYDSLVTADLNRDGKMDLLVRSLRIDTCGRIPPCATTSTKIHAFLGNGDGSFQGDRIVASATLSRFAGDIPRGYQIDHPFVGDFNGDGKLDLAYHMTPGISTLTSFIQIRLGKGDGTFASPVFDFTEPTTARLLAQDLNSDKLSDLVAVGTSNDIDVILNISPVSGGDLGILLSSSSPEPVGVGTNLTFAADVLNLGPHDVTGVSFADTLPNNVSFVSATATLGSCVQSHAIVSCNIGALASAFDFRVTIVVTPTSTGAITNAMSVTANEPDPVSANNTATQTAEVVPVFKLIVTKTGNGSGTVSSDPGINGSINCGSVCSAIYKSGTVVNVSESPDATSVLASWSGSCTGTGACAVTMTADQTVAANFVLGETLSVVLAGGGSGSVNGKDGAINCTNSGGICSSLYVPGTSVSLTAAPAGTSVFGEWSGACTGTDPNLCNLNLNSNQTVTATFNPPPDFTLALASTTFTTNTGAQVTDVLTLTEQNGFSGQVNLNCTVNGPAPLATCNVSPSSVTVRSSPSISTLTVTAPTALAAFALPLYERSRIARYAAVLPFPALLLGGIGLVSWNFKKRQRGPWLFGGCVIVLLAVLVGCGGVVGTPAPTSQTYTVTVNAVSAAGAVQHSTTVTLTVQ